MPNSSGYDAYIIWLKYSRELGKYCYELAFKTSLVLLFYHLLSKVTSLLGYLDLFL